MKSIFKLILTCTGSVVGFILLVPLLLVGLPFWVVAWVIRRIKGIVGTVEPWQNIIEYDGLLGWKPKANLNVMVQAEDIFDLHTGSDGWRTDIKLEESNIVVFGDSFSFGYGVGSQDFFAHKTGCRVKTIGAPGYSMVQSYLMMEQLKPRLKGKMIIWMVYLGNDLYENLKPSMLNYRSPFVRESNEGWEIVTEHLSRESWLPFDFVSSCFVDTMQFEMAAEICCDSFFSQRAYKAFSYLVDRAQQLCQEVDASLLIMTIPDSFQLSPWGENMLKTFASIPESFDVCRPDRQILNICRERNISCSFLKDVLKAKHYYRFDRHWTNKGHAKVAEVIKGIFDKNFVKEVVNKNG